jgi:hypothetical protein
MSPLEERMELVNFSSVGGLLEILLLEELHDLCFRAAEGELLGDAFSVAATGFDRSWVEALVPEVVKVLINHLLLMALQSDLLVPTSTRLHRTSRYAETPVTGTGVPDCPTHYRKASVTIQTEF